jgi:hypothetical protein
MYYGFSAVTTAILHISVSVVRLFGTACGLQAREFWLVWLVMLCGLRIVAQAAIGDGLSLNPFAFEEDAIFQRPVPALDLPLRL